MQVHVFQALVGYWKGLPSTEVKGILLSLVQSRERGSSETRSVTDLMLPASSRGDELLPKRIQKLVLQSTRLLRKVMVESLVYNYSQKRRIVSFLTTSAWYGRFNKFALLLQQPASRISWALLCTLVETIKGHKGKTPHFYSAWKKLGVVNVIILSPCYPFSRRTKRKAEQFPVLKKAG